MTKLQLKLNYLHLKWLQRLSLLKSWNWISLKKKSKHFVIYDVIERKKELGNLKKKKKKKELSCLNKH